METLSTPIRIPKSSKLYVFGSALTATTPNDLDVLVIYDPQACPPQKAYSVHRETVVDLEKYYQLPVHITLLTFSEEASTEFIRRTGAIEFATATKRLTNHSSGPARKATQAAQFTRWAS
jgi:predicted nucleotidyltransferase